MRILIIEPDSKLLERIRERLIGEGYRVDETLSIKDGEIFLGYRNFDLVIVDGDGSQGELFSFVHSARQDPYLKIVVLSSDHSEKNEIKLLKLGADDYIRKPFNLELLVARVNAHLRNREGEVLRYGDLVIDKGEEKVYFKGVESGLRGKPFEVFLHLAQHPHQVISKEQLLHAIWEEPEMVTPNVIEVAINQIRKRVDKHFKIDTIETIRRRGYKFCYPKE
ncbi:MAG: homeostatic response regulator transcription factor HsrA [Campylobacterales bacterium]